MTDASLDVADACEKGSMGSLATGPRFGIRTRQQCVDFCHSRCKRCRYVSFSKEMGDCSWYHKCDISLLQRSLGRGEPLPFKTRAVYAPEMEEA